MKPFLLLIVLFAALSCSTIGTRAPASSFSQSSCHELISALSRYSKDAATTSSLVVRAFDELPDEFVVPDSMREQLNALLIENIYHKNLLNHRYADLLSQLIGASGTKKIELENQLRSLEASLENFSSSKQVKDIYDALASKQVLKKSDLKDELSSDLINALNEENRYLKQGLGLPENVKDDLSEALIKIKEQSTIFSHSMIEEIESSILGDELGEQTINQAAEIFARTGNEQEAANYVASAFNLNPKYLYVKAKYNVSKTFAQKVYRPTLDFFRHMLEHGGEMWRKYISKQEISKELQRWKFVEDLHEKGKIGGSFGHVIHPGFVDVLGAEAPSAAKIQNIQRTRNKIGRDYIASNGKRVEIQSLEVSPMMNVSGMSFPQLSAESHITLLATQAKLAKQKGIDITVNTGEGGPMFHLALLDGDVEKLKREVIYWGLQTGDLKPGSIDYQKVVVRIEEIMNLRNQVLDKDTVKNSKIVAQFGTALNGIRSEDGFVVDFDKLKAIGEHPNVGMIQFKLDQAAKRGSKVDMNKVDAITAAMRRIDRTKGVQSPKTIEEFSNEELAKLITSTRLITKKPVSIKIAPGDLNFALERMKYLRDHNALPDHIQVDGSTTTFSPGSGNAPFGASVSMTTQNSVIAMDAIMKKLGVRNQVHIEASGGVIYPQDAVEMMVLGADNISSSRFYMGASLGCGRVRACANGSCPYGIAASNSIFAKGLDPAMRSDKGLAAAAEWHNYYVDKIAEMGVDDWTKIRQTHGLHVTDPTVLQRIKKRDNNGEQVFIKTYYRNYIYELLSPIMTKAEIDSLVLGES